MAVLNGIWSTPSGTLIVQNNHTWLFSFTYVILTAQPDLVPVSGGWTWLGNSIVLLANGNLLANGTSTWLRDTTRWTVLAMFADTGFNGQQVYFIDYPVSNKTIGIADVGTNNDFNDTMSSFYLISNNQTSSLTFYWDTNYEGEQYNVLVGPYSICVVSDVGNHFNDEMSSYILAMTA